MSDKPKRICRVVGCEREANTPGSARGLCCTHYLYRHEYDAGRPLKVTEPPVVPDTPITDFPRFNGPSPAVIDLGLVERSAHIGCTQGEIAALLDISVSCFAKHLKEDPAIQEALDRGREVGKSALRRMQWQNAENGNPTMQIWLGKNMLGQTDKIENSGSIDTGMRVIVELVGEAAPQSIEHSPQQERQYPRLVNDVDWKG